MTTDEIQQEGVDITPLKDGGVLKRIIKEGTGSDLPNPGDKVTVHYTGTLLDGTKFDSSKDRNDPFQFQLAKGNVIKAWDIGVATMKRGEVCMLTCKSAYAYGKAGSPPNIPPDATLLFEIEMIDWQGEDLSPKKNGGILRSQITAGEGYMSPNDGSQVEVHLVGRFEDRIFEDKIVSFSLGEGCEAGIVEGVEIALEKFKKGEKSRISLKPEYAFKDTGKPEFNIPPNATVIYEVELKSFEKAPESWSLDATGKVKQAQLYKDKGTKYFKAGNMKLATNMYKKMLDFLSDFEHTEDLNLVEQHTSLKVAAHLNCALCALKGNEHKEAVEHCHKALEMDPKNEKGLFRRGQAYMGMGEPSLAKQDFEAVLTLAPDNKAAANNVLLCSNQIKEQRQKEKKIYANMFEKFAQKDREEKVSHYGWWDGTRPVTPPPYVDEEAEEDQRAQEEAKRQKKEFIETVQKRKMEMAKEKAFQDNTDATNHCDSGVVPREQEK